MKLKETSPPKLAHWLLLRFLRDDLAEEVAGDLEEKFYLASKEKSLFKAKANYWFQVFNYLRPFAFRKSKSKFYNTMMLQNYLVTGWRNLTRQKMYSIIKIGGFALSIAVCALISLFIADELNYDKNLVNGNRLYRVVGVFNDNGEISHETWFQAPFASTLKEDYPEVEEVARLNAVELFGAGAKEFRRADVEDNSYDDGFVYVDPSILKLLEMPMVYRNSQALNKPKSIVISRKKAEKYFPHENPIGKLVVLNNDDKNPFTVGGVMEDRPSNSHFQFDFLITLKDFEFWPGEGTSWCCTNYQTYILFKPGTDAKAMEKKVSYGTIHKYILPQLIKQGVPNAEELLKNASLAFQPVPDIHLDSHIQDGRSHGDRSTILVFGGIAVFILIIACINFINLSTAKSANRAREVGIRKVVGSMRQNLVNQFLTESFIVSALAFFFGIALTVLLLPLFNDLASKSLSLPINDWKMWGIFVAAIFGIGLLAGLYPSFFLSKFKPIDVMKGALSQGSKGSRMRSALVILQFTISIVLIVGTLVVSKQMDFVLHQKIGFEKDQVLLLQGTGTLDKQIKTFKNELLGVPGVKSVSISDYLPVKGTKRNGNPFWNEGKEKMDRSIGGQNWVVDTDYVKTMSMQIVEGRDFDERKASDSAGAIINQAMVKKLNIKDPVGKVITNGTKYTVLGVVEDFHFETMRQTIEPLMMRLGISQSIVSVKLENKNVTKVIEDISNVWNKFSPHQPIRYSFMDQNYAAMYADVQRTEKLFICFAVLAIAIACLGLFGLSAFMIEQRNKEIGIRLVLGASVGSIFRLLTSNYLMLVAISFVIGTPIAWWGMSQWLQDFAYRIDLDVAMFAISGLIAAMIALLTISYQSLVAGRTKPAESLRQNN